ncbi:hypothetical protein FJT64_010496 [Amphibalanus amphitrite]|uniref:Uncharacterized protein n=1 Tax=Amphibalanus amphitrite TaxID=1232801 RepID=A0A6A4VMC5_AMPAM|nr:hypothetical protein FJT64_010496 [Amphibalanus amphitrite]
MKFLFRGRVGTWLILVLTAPDLGKICLQYLYIPVFIVFLISTYRRHYNIFVGEVSAIHANLTLVDPPPPPLTRTESLSAIVSTLTVAAHSSPFAAPGHVSAAGHYGYQPPAQMDRHPADKENAAMDFEHGMWPSAAGGHGPPSRPQPA